MKSLSADGVQIRYNYKMIQILSENPALFVILALSLVISLSVHEFAHAYVAMKLGDFTAKYMGRVTLNPLAHLDPVGTLMMLFVGFGWGKPVPVNPINFNYPKRDQALVSLAGPASNFVLAAIFTILFKFNQSVELPISIFFYLMVFYNLALGFFNLIPVFPLDGFRVVSGLLPYELSLKWDGLERFGLLFLLVIVLTRLTSVIVSPIIDFTLSLLGLPLI